MRQPFRSIPILLLILVAGAVPALGAPTLVRTLPNKSTLVLRENRTRPIVSIQAWIKSGSRDESRSERGAAAVLQQLMMRGSRTRVADEIEKDIALYGASFGNEVGYDYSMFQITLPARYFKTGADILSEIVTQPKLDTHDLGQSIGIARDQTKSILRQAEIATNNPIRETLWSGTPMASPLYVPELELAAVTMPLAVRYYKTHYVSENLTLVVVGDVDPAEVPAVMEKAFASMPQGKAPKHPKVQAKGAPSTKISFADPPPDAGAAFAVGFRGPAWGTADALALDVLLAALVDSPHSRILTHPIEGSDAFQNLTAQRSFDADGGTILLSGRIDPARAKDAEGALIALLAQARSAPISQDEVDDAVAAVVSRDGYYGSDMTGLGRATGLAYVRGRPGADEVYYDRLRTIRPEDLAGVAAQYLDLEHAAVVEMMPRAAADSVGAHHDFEGRIKEKLGINQAAYGKGPKVTQSTAQDRQRRIDAPLAKIPSGPTDMGRARVDKTTLSGGLRLLTSQDRSAPVVTVAVYLAGGTRYENETNNGVTTLLRESLLTSTDPKAAGAAYRHSLPDLGRFQPYQDKDMWGYSVSVPTSEWKDAATRLGTMLAHPELDSVTVDATRLYVMDALNKWSENDAVQRSWKIFPTKYVVSGYRLPSLGTRLNLLTMPYGTIMDWYKTLVVRGNIVVTVFGDVTPSEVGPVVDQAFSGVSSKPFQPPAAPKEPPFEGFREKWELGGGTDVTVNLAFNGPPARSRDVPVFYVVNSLLGGPRGWFQTYLNSNAALFKGSSSIVSQSVDESPLIASVVIAGPVIEEDGVKLLFRQFKKVAFYEMTAEEADTLRFAKINAAGTYLSLLGTNTSRAFQWGRAEVFGLGTDYPLTLPVKIDAVTAEDVQRIGLVYFEKDQFNRQPYAITETRPGGW